MTPKERVKETYRFAFCERDVAGLWQVYSRPVGVHGSNLTLGSGATTPMLAWDRAWMQLSPRAFHNREEPTAYLNGVPLYGRADG